MNFANNIWLVAALLTLPAMIALYFKVENRKRHRLERFAASKLIGDLAASLSPRKRNLKVTLAIVAVLLIAVALARPQWGYQWQETKGRGIDILIALDTSKSMLAQDIKPNRLERAKLAILDLVEQVEGDRIGLIAFSGTAFLQCPLTLDYDAFRQTLATVDTEIISVGGTDIASAIAEAQASFAQDDSFRILVLITDGEDLEAAGIERARLAGAEGVKVYTVGVGSPSGELIPITSPGGGIDFLRDHQGNVVKTRLDETTLSEIAAVTEGFYVPLGSTGEGLDEVYRGGLQSIPKQEREARLQQIPHERFQWPLGLAIAALIGESLLGTRRRRDLRLPSPLRSAGILILLLPFSLSDPLQASPREAESLYEKGDFKGAAEHFREEIERSPDDARLHFNLGATHYRAGAYEAALDNLNEALTTDDLELQRDAYYNLGDAYYRLGEAALETDPQATIRLWEEGLKQFENALDLHPEDEDANYNHEFLTKRLEELKKQLPKQPQQGDDESEENGEPQPQNSQEGDRENEQAQSPSDSSEEQAREPQSQAGQEDYERPSKEQEAESQAKQGQPPPGSEKEEEREIQAPPGHMTREEARQLLESMKSEERKLPLARIELQEHRTSPEREGKDW